MVALRAAREVEPVSQSRWTSNPRECTDCALCIRPEDGEKPFLVYEYEHGEPVLALCSEHALELVGRVVYGPREQVPA